MMKTENDSKLRRFRKRLGVTSTEAADLCGINQSTLIRIELGQTDPVLSTALRVQAWMDGEARRCRVPRAERVDLADLVPARSASR